MGSLKSLGRGAAWAAACVSIGLWWLIVWAIVIATVVAIAVAVLGL